MTEIPFADLAIAQPNPGQDKKTANLLDYLTTQPGHLTAFSESPLAQSRLLANPSEMAGKLGEYMEGLHERTEAVQEIDTEGVGANGSSSARTEAGLEPGPASALPRPEAAAHDKGGLSDSALGAYDGLFEDALATAAQLANFSMEMSLVKTTAGGAVSSVNNLLRGQ